jgi:hypothetical protein
VSVGLFCLYTRSLLPIYSIMFFFVFLSRMVCRGCGGLCARCVSAAERILSKTHSQKGLFKCTKWLCEAEILKSALRSASYTVNVLEHWH